MGTIGARPSKMYDVTIKRYRKSQTKMKSVSAHFAAYGFKPLCEVAFETSHNILDPHTTSYAFYKVLKAMTS